MKKYNTRGYSVVIAVVMIGFLLVLTSGVFNLVLRELNDTRAIGDYFRAYAGAEASQELALLQIKKHGFTFYDSIDHDPLHPSPRSIILARNPLDISDFNRAQDVLISYTIDSVAQSYTGTLNTLEYAIIPLFYTTSNSLGPIKTTGLNFSIVSGASSDLVRNIVGEQSGISGQGEFNDLNFVQQKELRTTGQTSTFELTTLSIGNFITQSSAYNYLILFNTSNTNSVEFNLSADSMFTKPTSDIISSAQVRNYKQNLHTTVDNTKFLNILKYSIFSN